MTARHNFSAGLALGHKATSSGNIHSPHPPHSPNPQSQAWAASPFLLLHSKAGAGEGTLWSWAEEGGSRGAACRRTPCLQAVEGGDLQALLPRQPARKRGFGNPAHSSHRRLLSVPRGFLPGIVPGTHKRGFVFPR